MKFRIRRANPASEAPADPMEESLDLAREPVEREELRWSTALLMVGSALLGATAIAFWNRRTIADLRDQMQRAIPTHAPPTDEEIL